jgi:hypothetical protein
VAIVTHYAASNNNPTALAAGSATTLSAHESTATNHLLLPIHFTTANSSIADADDSSTMIARY